MVSKDTVTNIETTLQYSNYCSPCHVERWVWYGVWAEGRAFLLIRGHKSIKKARRLLVVPLQSQGPMGRVSLDRQDFEYIKSQSSSSCCGKKRVHVGLFPRA